jgi:ankyrin repeat protein
MRRLLPALPCALLFVTLACRMAPPSTPLALAAWTGDTARVQQLLDAGVSPEEPDQRGLTPLQLAARAGQINAVRLLLDCGASINAHDGYVNGWTAMMHAVHKSQPRIVIAALMMAAGEADLDVVRALLAAGADPRARNDNHVTALTNGVAGGSTEVVRALLEAAPDLRLQDSIHDTMALWMARLQGSDEVIAMVQQPASAR